MEEEHLEDETSVSFEHLQAIRDITLITRNVYPLSHLQGNDLIKHDDLHAKCFCEYPYDEKTTRCDDVSCLNYATYIECHPSLCDAGQYCANQRLQHPEKFPLLQAFKTLEKGYGVRTQEAIPTGQIIGEYVGEVIDENELNRRLQLVSRNELNFYYLALESGIYIDARKKGSFTRFMNHSCEPNCKTEKWTVQGELRIAVLTIRPIEAMEELTFDYQWKSLGTKPIKCCCGAVTCKGIIGTESEQEIPNGFFREPTTEEVHSDLVGRRIRIVVNINSFRIATVLSHIEKQIYQVEYEEEEEEKKQQVDLSLETWHLFVALDGLSQGQIEVEVGAIPKRRVSPSLETPLPSTSCPSSPQQPIQQHVTTKLLIKGIPSTYQSEGMFQKMLERVDPRRSSHPQTQMIQHVDLFFFSSIPCTGWALVEFTNTIYPPLFKRMLDQRTLEQRCLRVFYAGEKETESYERTKRNVLLESEKEEEKKQEETIERKEKEPLVYYYGKRFDWIVSIEQVENSPSRESGISLILEDMTRKKIVQLIMDIAKVLKIDRQEVSSSILALHRYYTIHPMTPTLHGREPEIIAAAILIIYLKAYGRKSIDMELLFKQVYYARYHTTIDKKKKKEDLILNPELYRRLEQHLIQAQGIVMEELYYDLSMINVYSILEMMTNGKWKQQSTCMELAPSEVLKESKHLIADVFKLSIWASTRVECVVLSIFYIGTATILALNGGEKGWNVPSIPNYLPCVENEKESLMLLETCMTLVNGLTDRWKRLEKQMKRVQDPMIFDIDRYAVHKEKPVDLIQRLSDCFHHWIPLIKPSRDIFLTFSKVDSRFKVPVTRPFRLYVADIQNLQQIRRRSWIGTISTDCPLLIAGQSIYLQPWPYRDHENVMDNKTGFSKACARELSNVLMLNDPSYFLPLVGIIFPNDTSSTLIQDKTQLDGSKYYLAFQQPLHTCASLLETQQVFTMSMRKQVIYNMLKCLQTCHEAHYVHRMITSNQVYIFSHRICLGGYTAIRRMNTIRKEPSYEMTEFERKELCMGGSWMQGTAPELLLGSLHYTTRCDIWSAGCLILSLLFDKYPLLQGSDISSQLNLIYRLCGTPMVVWSEGLSHLPLLSQYPPKHEYKMRLRKTLMELREKQKDVPISAISVLENMLQWDPMKRSSIKTLLEMEYFKEDRTCMDSSQIPSTLLNQSKTIRVKKQKEKPTRRSSAPLSSRHKSQHLHRVRSTGDVERIKKKIRQPSQEDVEDVPLPSSLVMLQDENRKIKEPSEPLSKRAKLGWGMGLHANV